MPRTEPFDRHADAYDAWFDAHADLYRAELIAVRELLPARGAGLEVGVGSGRFAGPLGIAVGVDPSETLGARARARGIDVHRGVAEALPFADGRFDFVLLVTTICFLDDLPRSFREAARVLRSGGSLVIGFVDRESELGRRYESGRAASPFYRLARFVSVPEVLSHLENAGLEVGRTRQALVPGEPTDTVLDGFGRGGFVVLEAFKPRSTAAPASQDV